jgi:hypothetical protein
MTAAASVPSTYEVTALADVEFSKLPVIAATMMIAASPDFRLSNINQAYLVTPIV